jgi:outer membrane protein assembly factor BamE
MLSITTIWCASSAARLTNLQMKLSKNINTMLLKSMAINLPTIVYIYTDYIPSAPTLSLIKPYKADVNQGTVLNRLSINQLKIGLSKKQVQEIIGTPSIIDPFHNNQWDYINHSIMGSGEVIRYRLTLKFEGLKLVNINTDGISSLPKLTDKQKILQETRIAKEKAKALEEKRLGLMLRRFNTVP